MKKRLLATAAAMALWASAPMAQTVQKVQPEFWYAGMESRSLQIMIYGKDVSKCKASICSPLVEQAREQRVSSPNYLFLCLTLAPGAKPGDFAIELRDSTSRKKAQQIRYELRERTPMERGLSGRDLMYMVMPDRFSNGSPANDNMPGMLEAANPASPDGRHGGDIMGIGNHVDYLSKLGITALWINPLLENNMPAYSYHGYAITDFYKVDSRLGTNEDYRDLAERLRQSGIKLVMDMVFNHCGSGNFIFQDLPDSSWVHAWPQFTRSNYRGTVCFDPHASEGDKKFMTDGWFDTTMPDLNQDNELLMDYLIQNSVWWAEYLGLSAIRMDTYPYNSKEAMKRWCQAMHREFPGISLLGEVWLNENPFVSYFASGIRNIDGYSSGLDHVTDFPLTFALSKAFAEDEGWDTGAARIYQHFVSDYLVPDPGKNVIFADNHDLCRIATLMDGNVSKLKMIYTIILTARGIPCLYYGSEVMMDSPKDGDGYKRQNMPGGWPGDVKSAFTGNGLSESESQLMEFVSRLANFRKGSPAFSGKMIHFVPQDGVYVYFRISQSQRVMVAINTASEPRTVDSSRFQECLNGCANGRDVISGNVISLGQIELPPLGELVIDF